MSKQKVTFWIEEGEVELLKEKFRTKNQSEAIRLAIMQSLAMEELERVKTLFPYIGKKPPRIGREVVNAFEQSGCEIFVDLFCGSLAMLCYLPSPFEKQLLYMLHPVHEWHEKDVSFDELSEEYNVFQKTGNSKMFAWMYVINDNFGIVIDSHIYLYHYDKKMYEQQKVVIPWMYTESKKYIGDTWWFEDQEIIEDIQKLSLLDFLEKYRGY